MGRFASGVTIVTSTGDGDVRGMTANGFVSVSVDPPLVLVSLARNRAMHDLVRDSGRYAVNVLGAEQEALSWHFAGQPIQRVSPEFVWRDGLPLIDGALAHVSCRVRDTHPAGDHTLYVGEVTGLDYRDGRPLVFYTGSYGSLEARVVDDSLFM
jgi:flavin reductase (DIM6/NTAB) family NADH-FMN oxidoreductase RutF